MTTKQRMWLGFKRGLRLRCPGCGKGPLFRRFISVNKSCSSCGLTLEDYPSDDAPPYIATFILPWILIPGIYFHDTYTDTPMWILLTIWIFISMVLVVISLPPIKGSVIGVLWALEIKRESS